MANLDVDNVSINTVVLNEGGSRLEQVGMNLIVLAADPDAGTVPFAGAFAKHKAWAVGAFARRRIDRTLWSKD